MVDERGADRRPANGRMANGRGADWRGADWRGLAALVSRFGLIGLINTAVGFTTTACLDVGLHLAPALANAGGYAVGIPLSFVLTRSFVFRHKAAATATGPKYLIVVASAFLLNQLVLRLAGAVLGPGALPHLLAQLMAMGTYTVTTFLACRLWVFRPGEAAPV